MGVGLKPGKNKRHFKTSYIAVLINIVFEFRRSFKLHKVVKYRIHFNTS